MSITAVYEISCDHCGVHPIGNPRYRSYEAALTDLAQLVGWYVSPAWDTVRYVFCRACMSAEARHILARMRN